jgi:hypothetical protein
VSCPLDEILLLCLFAVLAGAECFTEIALFGVKKLEFLRRFLYRNVDHPRQGRLGQGCEPPRGIWPHTGFDAVPVSAQHYRLGSVPAEITALPPPSQALPPALSGNAFLLQKSGVKFSPSARSRYA